MKKTLLIGGSSLLAASLALFGGWLMRGCSERKAAEADRVAYEQALQQKHAGQKATIQEDTQRMVVLNTLQIEAWNLPHGDNLADFLDRINKARDGKADSEIERMIKLLIDCGKDRTQPIAKRIENQEKLAQRLIKEYYANRR